MSTKRQDLRRIAAIDELQALIGRPHQFSTAALEHAVIVLRGGQIRCPVPNSSGRSSVHTVTPSHPPGVEG